jgi:putative ABC transport system ATP-binding protein
VTAVIAMRGVGLTYPGPPAVPALRPADLSVARGEYVTVVGPSGSGKSTLLNVTGLLDRPTEGRYELDGIDVGTMPEKRRATVRATRIGFVFQAFHLLLYRTATENVALALLYGGVPIKQRTAAARAALDRVGLAHRAEALPATMSGGERQRVAIARALVHGPSLLLCDEPTGNLDSGTAASVLDLFDGLHADGMTIMMITHDPNVAIRGERTVTIRDGVLHE